MPTEQPRDEVYRAKCSCGWSIERDASASNLPEENNREIVRKVAEIHESRPRFGRDENHSTTDPRRLVTDGGESLEHGKQRDNQQTDQSKPVSKTSTGSLGYGPPLGMCITGVTVSVLLQRTWPLYSTMIALAVLKGIYDLKPPLIKIYHLLKEIHVTR